LAGEAISPELIKSAPGNTILAKSSLNLAAPTGFTPEVDLVLADIKQLSQYQLQQLSALQHQDSFLIKSVPITEVKALYNQKTEFHYWVFGTDNKVEIKPEWGYPSQYCCGLCTIN
jgi:hypothetical protein